MGIRVTGLGTIQIPPVGSSGDVVGLVKGRGGRDRGGGGTPPGLVEVLDAIDPILNINSNKITALRSIFNGDRGEIESAANQKRLISKWAFLSSSLWSSSTDVNI